MFATFAGDKEYQNIRQRVTRIARYKPYRRIAAVSILIAAVLCIAAMSIWIKNISYDRNNINDTISIHGFDGKNVTFYDTNDVLRQMISYDDSFVYVDREAFENYLQENNATGDIIIVFGGFYKLPGVGGIGCHCYYYEFDSKEQIVKIPYENPMSGWKAKLLKML